VIVQNSPLLKALLKSWPNLQKQTTFVIDDKEFQKHYKECEKQHSEESLEYRHMRAIMRCLTIDSKAIAIENAVQHHHYNHDNWFKWVVIGLLVLLILLVASQRAHAQNVTPAIAVATCGNQSLTAGQPTHLTVNLTGAECTSSSGTAMVVLGTTSGTGVIGTVLQGSPPWTIDLTRVNGQAVATNGAGVLAIAGATSPGLIVQGQGNGGTPVTVTWPTASIAVSPAANSSVNLSQVNGITTATNGAGVQAVAGASSSGLAVQGQGNGGTPVTVSFVTATVAVNTSQWNGTTAATTPYNSGAAAVIGFQTSSLSIQGQLNGGTPVTVTWPSANVGVTATGSVATGGSVTSTNPVFVGGYGNSGTSFPIVTCDNNVQGGGIPAGFYGNTSGSAQIIAAPGAPKRIAVCAWGVTAYGTATTVKFVYGTGTNCGTGGTNATGAYSLPINGNYQEGGGLGIMFAIPVAQALCINNSGVNFIGGSVTYTVFGILLLPTSFLYKRRRNIIRNIWSIISVMKHRTHRGRPALTSQEEARIVYLLRNPEIPAKVIAIRMDCSEMTIHKINVKHGIRAVKRRNEN
jgi:hypothetical protein